MISELKIAIDKSNLPKIKKVDVENKRSKLIMIKRDTNNSIKIDLKKGTNIY